MVSGCFFCPNLRFPPEAEISARRQLQKFKICKTHQCQTKSWIMITTYYKTGCSGKSARMPGSSARMPGSSAFLKPQKFSIVLHVDLFELCSLQITAPRWNHLIWKIRPRAFFLPFSQKARFPGKGNNYSLLEDAGMFICTLNVQTYALEMSKRFWGKHTCPMAQITGEHWIGAS